VDDLFRDTVWQMTPRERTAVQSALAEVRPRVAVEIGTAAGGSLRRIAAASGHVHTFDLAEPPAELRSLANVSFHTGDSHELLPRVLAELAATAATVDFVLVDGDHSAAGVRRDLEDLLDSPAIRSTVILVHDTTNPAVRAGLEAIDLSNRDKLGWVELDWVEGFVFGSGPHRGEAWGGLGLLLVDDRRPAGAGAAVIERPGGRPRLTPLGRLARRGRRRGA
jgi:hypothetical protein